MAYSVNNPPALMTSALVSRNVPTPLDGSAAQVGNKQPALWILSGTDALATVDTSGYITNARDLGMQKGDLVLYVKTDAAPISIQMMIVAAINANGSADLSDGTAIVATNTD